MIAPSDWRSRIQVNPTRLALIGILLMAFGLRIYGWNWDEGNYLHPDERYIVSDVMIARIHFSWSDSFGDLLDPATSGLNPRSADPNTGQYREFAYGAMPVLLTDLAAEMLGWFTKTDWHDYDHAYRIGRPLSAFLDTMTVLLVFVIGRRLAGSRVGLLAAVVAACTPLTIQLAHFFTTDSWLTFFVTLCLYFAIRASESGAVGWFASAGAAFGWAMACKGSVFTLAVVLAVAGVFHLWRRWRWGDDPTGILTAAAERLAVTGGAAVVAFAMFEPYALLEPAVYRKSLQTQADIVRGIFDVPFTRQYVGTTPIVYQVEQLARWEFGPVALLLAVAGALLLLWRQRRGIGGGAAVLLAWLAVYGVVISVPEVKFIRYLAPVVPVLAVLAGLALDRAWDVLNRRFNPRLGMSFAGLALAGIGLWAAGFSSIYAKENTRLAASAWIYANVPSGSILSNEYWDDQLPKDLGVGLNGNDRQYGSVTFDLYSDRVSYRDLAEFGAVLNGREVTAAAGAALSAGDYRTAAERLRQAGPAMEALPPEERDGLAFDLEAFGRTLSGPAGGLGGACRGAADALRRDVEAVPDAFSALADQLDKAGSNEAANYLYGVLQQIDYYVISSNRVLSAMPRSPWRYPVQSRFYDLLASGELGFHLVKEVHRYPGIGPIRFSDDGADESFLNYDHPHVWIYQRDQLVDRDTYDTLMLDARMQVVTPARYPDDEKLMLDEPVGQLPVVDDARWSEAVTGNSFFASLVWILLLVVLQAAAWPWARLVFSRFADGGWVFARLLALLTSGYLVWIGASLEIISFRAIWTAAALAAVAAAGWALRLRWSGVPGGWELNPGQRRVAMVGEIVFWGVFGLFLLYRYLNPDSWHPIWGGEKPMEFAHLNATLRSAHFPPYDPWYADGYINYYYYGLYLVAFCLKLTGIPSEIGFNLAQPTVIAMLAATGYGVAATLGRDLARRGVAVPAGLLGTLLLVGIGNLDEFARWIDQPDLRDFGWSTWAPTRVIDGTINEFPYFTGLYADLHAHVVALPITVLAIGLGYSLAREPHRFALAVLRPRRERPAVLVIAARFGLLALAVGTLFATNAWDVATYLALGMVALFMASMSIKAVPARIAIWVGTAAVLGGLAYGLFLPFHQHYVALFSSIGEVRDGTNFWQFSLHFGGLLAIAGLGLVAVLVARSREDLPVLGQPGLAIVVVLAALMGRNILPADRDSLRDALTIVVVATPVLVVLVAAWIGAGRARALGELETAPLIRVALAAVAIASVTAIAADREVLGVLIAIGAAGIVAWLVEANPAARYLALMVGGAALIAAATEVVFLADNLKDTTAYRMNTVFKFYNQVWVLLALGGAALVVWMVTLIRPAFESFFGRFSEGSAVGLVSGGERSADESEDGSEVEVADVEVADTEKPSARTLSLLGPIWAQAGVAVAAVVVALSLFYPVLATRPRLEQRFADHLGSGTLNALDWMHYGTLPARPDEGTISFEDDLAAIDWLNEHVEGSPVIAEASIGPYRCDGSRFSIATGLPTIIGWENHLTQQRFPEGLSERVSDVRTLYTSTDAATKLSILRRYGVEYVIVGSLERLNISVGQGGECVADPRPQSILVFDQMVGSSLEIAFQQGGTTIYRVLPEVETGAGT